MSASVFAVKKPKPEELLLMIEALQAQVTELQAQVDGNSVGITTFEDLLDGMYRDDSSGYDTLVFTGMNLQLVNGTGSTDGTSLDAEGTGNLIIGYNHSRDWAENIRTGSHNLVIGDLNNYTANSFGGMVVGLYNEIDGRYASVSGGKFNTASGEGSSVSGGYDNEASGHASSVSGGLYNDASYGYSSVSGGRDNTASGYISSISGGWRNTASGLNSFVSGGQDNTASGWNSSVSGGYQRTARGRSDWRAGSLFEDY